MALGFSRIIDLTHTVHEGIPNWEGSAESPMQVRVWGNIERDGYFSRYIAFPEHFGTHIDAPAHFAAAGWTVEQIPPQRLSGPLVVLRLADRARADHDYQVSADDVTRWEQAHGPVPRGAIVLADCGWAARWHSMQEYRNPDAPGTPHYPGYGHDAVRLLVEGRGVVGIGIDTMGVDHGPTRTHPNHLYTSARNIYHLENVAHLDQAPEAGATLVVAPMKLKGGSGGPVRLLALVA